MTKKKKAQPKAMSLGEVLGFNKIFQNDIFNFITGLLLLTIAIFIIIAFCSYLSTGHIDQSLLSEMRNGDMLNEKREFANYCGSIGAMASYFFISRCFGLSAFIVPVLIGIAGLKMIKAYKVNLLKSFLILTTIMLWCSVTFATFLTPIMGQQVYNPGGDHGMFCRQWLENTIGEPGLLAILIVVAIIFLTYISNETISVVRKVLNPVSTLTNKVKFNITNSESPITEPAIVESATNGFEDPEPKVVNFEESQTNENNNAVNDTSNDDTTTDNSDATDNTDTDMTIIAAGSEEKAHGATVTGVDLNTPINPKEPWIRYKYPTLDLLQQYANDGKPYIDMKEQNANKNRIIEVLNSFGVQIKTITATVGPTITLYEITPAEGVRISKIRNLEDDIALSLSALGIRIIAPIPGKGTIGIEVPNAKANIVSMESILNSKRFQESTMELPIALGKTITNEIFMVDLAKIPHLLVAGATGQGKSVGLNAIITSLLYKKHPNELKIVLIDPKKVEFSVYAPIANQFLAKVPDDNEEPIITDVTKVIRTLNSLCKLMDHRYDMLKMAGARNIKEYNKKYVNHHLKLTDGHEYMPYIVVIIDEFGDLIMTAGKEIELPIARIAQLARAVGIHMVIATQRPTTSIITGNIKANFPGRMAFKVSSMIDSRTILDRPGANQLIGRGDMLFLQGNEPVRVQCAFVDTPEVERINTFIAQQPGPVCPFELPEPTDDSDEAGGGGNIDLHSLDPLFEQTARAIVISQQGSTSMIQRRFSIGYNRAGRIMEQMEKAGIVGAPQGSKPREVLVQDETSLENLINALRR